jgi:hypothetical protein
MGMSRTWLHCVVADHLEAFVGVEAAGDMDLKEE